MRKLLLLTIVGLVVASGSGCCSSLTPGGCCFSRCWASFCRFEDWKLQHLTCCHAPRTCPPAPIAAPVYGAPYVIPPAAAPCAPAPAPIITQPLSTAAPCQSCPPAPVVTQPLSVPATVQPCAPAPICPPVQVCPQTCPQVCPQVSDPCGCQPVNPCDPCAMSDGMPVITTPGPVTTVPVTPAFPMVPTPAPAGSTTVPTLP